jgi:hypothetical protein
LSLLNAWVTRGEAVVAVDTDGAAQDGARIVASKLLPIPHLNAVIGLRGQFAFLSLLFLRCASSSFESFDEMLEALPVHLAAIDEHLPEELVSRVLGDRGNELIAVGWSDRQTRMLGRRFVKRGGAAEFEVADFRSHVSPWDKNAMAGLPVQSPAAVERIARAQVQWMRSTFEAICGGKLIVCRVTRDSMMLDHRLTFEAQEVEA